MDKETMKSVMRIIVRIVTAGNEQTVPGLEMASKVSIIICDIELGKPDMLPKTGRNSAVRQEATL
jgi:hypothetical protein